MLTSRLGYPLGPSGVFRSRSAHEDALRHLCRQNRRTRDSPEKSVSSRSLSRPATHSATWQLSVLLEPYMLTTFTPKAPQRRPRVEVVIAGEGEESASVVHYREADAAPRNPLGQDLGRRDGAVTPGHMSLQRGRFELGSPSRSRYEPERCSTDLLGHDSGVHQRPDRQSNRSERRQRVLQHRAARHAGRGEWHSRPSDLQLLRL